MGKISLNRARVLALALAVLSILLLRAVAPGLVSGINEHSDGAIWRLGGSEEERRVVVVDIDEASLSRLGPWPWPRQRMAELLRRLADLGAGPVAFDIVFPDAKIGDDEFAKELMRHPAVLAQIFSLQSNASAATGKLQGALTAPGCSEAYRSSPLPLVSAGGYIGNAGSLKSPTGHITPRIDADGAVRHLPALICHEGRAYPALGIAALIRAAGADNALQMAPGKGLLDPAWWLSHPGLPGMRLPLASNGDIRLSYQMPRKAFISISASDVLEGRAPAHYIRGAWVLVGATAFGMGDAVPTPHGGAVGGVEVHAQFISAMLDGRLPYTPIGATLFSILLGAAGALCLLGIAIGARHPGTPATAVTTAAHGAISMPVWGLPLIASLLAGACFALHGSLLLLQHLWLGWAEPAMFILLTGLLLAAVEHAHTRFERERLFGNLSTYLPAPVAREIAFNQASGAIQAERRQVTVLFADIRNFSAYCEGRPPEETAALLHAFFTTAVRIVAEHHGVVEELSGDAVMAVWNSHGDHPEHAAQAYAAARSMLEECNPLFPDPPPPGLEPLAVGVGLECGDALVGSFGPLGRRTHAVMGETVTVAARLTAMTGELAEPLLVGEKAATCLPESGLSSLGEFMLEGLRRPRSIYAPAVQTPVLTLVHAIPRREMNGS